MDSDKVRDRTRAVLLSSDCICTDSTARGIDPSVAADPHRRSAVKYLLQKSIMNLGGGCEAAPFVFTEAYDS